MTQMFCYPPHLENQLFIAKQTIFRLSVLALFDKNLSSFWPATLLSSSKFEQLRMHSRKLHQIHYIAGFLLTSSRRGTMSISPPTSWWSEREISIALPVVFFSISILSCSISTVVVIPAAIFLVKFYAQKNPNHGKKQTTTSQQQLAKAQSVSPCLNITACVRAAALVK